MDFEPLPDGRLGFEFVNPLGPEDIDAKWAQAVSDGALLWLIGAGLRNAHFDRPPLPRRRSSLRGYPCARTRDRGSCARYSGTHV
ncbi:hypothetical protein [Streptomyces sp. MMBL 11-1]|uniref:hypothetical protein n=1 Tax=Streptomyces sp. MMBL 11-1 TaxID=3026420 RepID=UPI00235E9EC2|nr:hypothetical protein [Streptomyces sp. MMBL 11-1]